MSNPNPDESESPEQMPSEAEINAQKEVILKQILDSPARMRLNNIKMVKTRSCKMVETI